MQRALDTLWPLVGELFRPDPGIADAGIMDTVSGDAFTVSAYMGIVDHVLTAAGLERPGSAAPLGGVSGRTGRDGVHTEAMGFILAELQSVARAYPAASW
jgi:ring-1,2-phenylacetyl-CoA epoxidase subunit PaaC